MRNGMASRPHSAAGAPRVTGRGPPDAATAGPTILRRPMSSCADSRCRGGSRTARSRGRTRRAPPRTPAAPRRPPSPRPREPLEEPEQVPGPRAATQTLEAGPRRRGEGADAHPVEVGEADVPDGGGQVLGEQELARMTGRHRRAGIDHEEDIEILFFGEELDEEAVEARDDV